MKSGERDFSELCLDKCRELSIKYGHEEILELLKCWESTVEGLKRKDRDELCIVHSNQLDGG